jgi:hypothetical protein
MSWLQLSPFWTPELLLFIIMIEGLYVIAILVRLEKLFRYWFKRVVPEPPSPFPD